jgi:hypothetical protein
MVWVSSRTRRSSSLAMRTRIVCSARAKRRAILLVHFFENNRAAGQRQLGPEVVEVPLHCKQAVADEALDAVRLARRGRPAGADRTLTIVDLPKKSRDRVFHERVPLPSRARGRIRISDAWRYAVLAEAVEAWALRLMQDRAEFFDRATAARLWFDEEYVPVVEMLARPT